MKIRQVAAFFLLGFVGSTLSACAGGRQNNPTKPADVSGNAQQEGNGMKRADEFQLLVGFADAKSAEKRAQYFSKLQGKDLGRVGSGNLYLLQLPMNSNLKEAIRQLETQPGVAYAEPNIQMRTMKVK